MYLCDRFNGERFLRKSREGSRCESCTVPAAVSSNNPEEPTKVTVVFDGKTSEGEQVRKPAIRSKNVESFGR